MLDWLSEYHIFEIAAIIGAIILVDLFFIAKKKRKDNANANANANNDGGD